MTFAELRGQLVQLESAVSHVPACVIKELLQSCVEDSKEKKNTQQQEYAEKHVQLNQAKVHPHSNMAVGHTDLVSCRVDHSTLYLFCPK